MMFFECRGDSRLSIGMMRSVSRIYAQCRFWIEFTTFVHWLRWYDHWIGAAGALEISGLAHVTRRETRRYTT